MRRKKIRKNNILLAVTGSVAAYKAVEILRLFKKNGFNVRVIISQGGEHFITPFAFESTGAEKVYTDKNQFETIEGASIHLYLSRWADVIIIAPASADMIAKISSGISENLLLTTLLAFNKPVFIFPCMNEKMYINPITQANIKYLRSLGYIIDEPKEGPLADLEFGKGRMDEPKNIFSKVSGFLTNEQILSDKRVLVTAGATREYIDPVRFISNGSSGIMGFSIAKKAKFMGARVHLIYGDVREEIPYADYTKKVITTEEMFNEVKKEFPNCDILIMAAAPSDYRVIKQSSEKLPKLKTLDLRLTETVDILKEISKIKKDQIIVGFALQTEELEKKAIEKMKAKKMDIVVANYEGNIGKETGSAIIIDKKGNKSILENVTKDKIAEEILSYVYKHAQTGGKNGKK